MIDLFHTTREPMRSFVADMQARENRDSVLSLSAAHGFPWGDVADMGTRMLAITDGRPEHAARVAAEFGERLFAMRGRAQKPPMTIEAALEQAGQANATPIVIADTADNAGGGAPSDSTFLLQAVLDRRLQDVAIGPLWDPIAAAVAMDAGEGATLDLRIGGKMGATSGKPLDLRVTVGRTCRNARQTYGPSHESLGDCVAVRADGVEIVLNTLRTQAFGTELFTNVGIDPADRRIVIVKSTQHFFAGYGRLAADVLYVGGPGTLERDLTRLPFRKIRRPKWPFDQV
jgi:microcystin degradation protein MlrC